MKKEIILLFAILTLGCSKGDNSISEEQKSFNLTTETTSVMEYRYVIIKTDLTLNQNTYKGSFGGKIIEFAKLSDNDLIFIVPQINVGKQKLELIIEDRVGKLEFEVSENLIQNADNIINTRLIDPINNFNQNIKDLISNNTLSQQINNNLVSANQMLDDYLTKFNTISEAEKIEVAKFYNANPFFTDNFLNLSTRTNSNGNTDYDCFNFNSQKFIFTTLSVLAYVHFLPHLIKTGPGGSIAAFVGFVAGVYAAVNILSAAQELLLEKCLIPFEHSLKDTYDNSNKFSLNKAIGNSNNLKVNNDSFRKFTITSHERHIISSDITNLNVVVSTTLEKINLVKGKWESLKNGVNTLTSNTTGWFKSWFSSSSTYSLITYDFPSVPTISEEITSEGDSKFITIEGFPSDVSVQVMIASNNSINLKLKTDPSTLPRTVTGKIKYNDGDFITQDEFIVTIEKADFDFTGSWLTTFYFSADPALGVDYIHSQDRFTLDASGYAPTYEQIYPHNPPPYNDWQQIGEGDEVNLSYANGIITLHKRSNFYVRVNKFEDNVFYSDNWDEIYTNDYYKFKVKLERQ